MIIVTVGMQLGFGRPIAAIDALASSVSMKMIAQTGNGPFQLHFLETRVKIAPVEFASMMG